MVSFEQHWTQVLSTTQDAGDILASIRESAINHYLQRHFALDNSRYTVRKVIVCKVEDQGVLRDLPVTIAVSVLSPISLNFPPYGAAAPVGGAWTELRPPEPPPNLSQDNVRVRTDQVSFSISWPSVFEPGRNYSWQPSPISFEAEAYIRLVTAGGPKEEGRYSLNLQLIRCKFNRPQRVVLDAEISALIARLAPADRSLVQRHAIDKFDELLVIALNTAATELAPRFSSSIDIPVPVVAQQRLTPRALLVSDDLATVTFGLAENRLRETADEILNRTLLEVESALEEDITAAGGLRALLIEDAEAIDWDSLDAIQDVRVRSEEAIQSLLKRTRLVAQKHEARAAAALPVHASGVAMAAPVVPDGVGVAFNEYLLDTVAATFARMSPKQCTDWLDLGAVRGRACYWARIFDADVSVSQSGNALRVGGSIAVDVGGSVEGCVRKFWDCSWRWACSELRLAIAGRPGIELSLVHANFIALTARIVGRLTLETNLPFPFDKIVSALGTLIWEGVKAVLNSLLAVIQIQIVPGKLSVPQQRTSITLSGFAPRYFGHSGGTVPKTRYAAFAAGVTAG